MGLALEGVTLRSQIYIEAAGQAVTLASQVIISEPVPRPMRSLPRREAELRLHTLRGDFIGPPDPGTKRFCVNVASIQEAMRETYVVRRNDRPIFALVDYVHNPEMSWLVCDIPTDRLTPYQRNAGKRAHVYFYYFDPKWVVGINGIPLATFERLWVNQDASALPEKPSRPPAE